MLKKIVILTLINFISLQNVASASSNSSNNTGAAIEKPTKLEVTQAWARPSSTSTSAIYMNVKNSTAKDQVLNFVTAADTANKVSIHQTAKESDGRVKMVEVDKVVIPAGQTVEFKPGGLHIMLIDLKQALKVGDKFNATLRFEDSSSEVIVVEVKDKTM